MAPDYPGIGGLEARASHHADNETFCKADPQLFEPGFWPDLLQCRPWKEKTPEKSLQSKSAPPPSSLGDLGNPHPTLCIMPHQTALKVCHVQHVNVRSLASTAQLLLENHRAKMHLVSGKSGYHRQLSHQVSLSQDFIDKECVGIDTVEWSSMHAMPSL